MSMKTFNSPAILGGPHTGFRGLDLPDHQLVTPDMVDMLPFMSGAAQGGYNAAGDIITQTTDGRDLNDLWAEFQQTVSILNGRRQLLIDLLTFPVQNVIEDVPQIGSDDFEEASEFGEPKGIRAVLTYFSMAYDFKWYDVATRYTWKFLADATAAQVEAVHQSVLEADNRLVYKKVMNTLFNNVNRAATINGQNYTVYSLYNADGTVPPAYTGFTFDGTHTHYLVSGNANVDSTDLDDLIEHLRHHGYSAANGTTLYLLANSQETKFIRMFRQGVVNNNSAVALYDFVPAQGTPPQLSANVQGLIGTQPGATFRGMTVIGQYGPLLIIEEDQVPAGYMAIVGSGGEGNLNNPIGIREHPNATLRGLRLLRGTQTDYPLQDAFYQRGFGTGVRQRGGAAVMQIKASGSYAVPTPFVGV